MNSGPDTPAELTWRPSGRSDRGMIAPELVEARIRAGIDAVSYVHIKDLTGTQDHFEATVVSGAFEGKTKIEQHQLVYSALGELMAGPVHALALNTYTPDGWASRKDEG